MHSKIKKALMLLDRDLFLEAEQCLRIAIQECEASGDELNLLRAACILGEVLYDDERDSEAAVFLRRVAMAQRDDDLLDYEIGRAQELLADIEKGLRTEES